MSDKEAYLNHRERRAIVERLAPLMANPAAPGALADTEFNDLALAVFRYQFTRVEPFRRLCEARGVGPGLDDWRRIPHVPTEAFKSHRLACFPETLEGARFQTSGTTIGRPGVHSMVNTEIYDAAAIPWFALHVLPERYPEICSAGAPSAADCGVGLRPAPDCGARILPASPAREPATPPTDSQLEGECISRLQPAPQLPPASAGGSGPTLDSQRASARLLDTASAAERPFRFISLTLSSADAPNSSLSHMIQTAGERLLHPDELWPETSAAPAAPVRYCYGPEGLRLAALIDALAAVPPGARVILFTTAFALAQAMEAGEARGLKFPLPAGSRVMETGGYKGRARALAKSELYARAAALLAVPVSHIINEYGMTEMSSQFYDPCLIPRVNHNCGAGLRPAPHDKPPTDDPDYHPTTAPERRLKRPPPWVCSRALDLATLREVPPGEIGVLAHTDLANIDSCAFLQTADAARAREDGFELLGRMEEIEPRGCSLVYEE